MKKFFLVLIVLLLAGCGTAVSSTTGTTQSSQTTGTTQTTQTTQTSNTTQTTQTTVPTVTDAEKVALDLASLTISGDLLNVTTDLTLPTGGNNGTTISWISSNEAVIDNTGKVTRPVYGNGDASVILTATVQLNNASDTKDFTIVVKEAALVSVCTGVVDPSIYEIYNAGFESGDLCGWTASGDAFTDNGVTDTTTFYDATFDRDGAFHFSTWAQGGEETTGTLTSSTFELGGSGYITFKLGGGKRSSLTYVSIMKEDGSEVARFGNSAFVDGLNTAAQLNLYKADLSEYLGQKLYFVIVDNATSDWGIITLDSFITYFTDVNTIPQNAVEAVNIKPVEIVCPVTAPTQFDIINGGFEEGNLCGWTADGEAFTNYGVTNNDSYWGGTYGKDGNYLFTTQAQGGENTLGSITSSIFELGGTGYITFKMGAAKHTDQIYVSVYKADGTEVARFGNTQFTDDLKGNLVQYQADLSRYLGEMLYIKVVDNGFEDWAWVTLDSFITYHETTATLPVDAFDAINTIVISYDNQIVNGGFETGNLSGWTIDGEAFSDTCVVNDTENNSFGYYFKPWGCGEDKTGTLTSSVFTLGGSGYITFKLGAAKHQDQIYVSVYLADGTEVARYSNINFDNNGYAYLYKADLTEYLGQDLYFQVVDYATTDWGLIVVDDVNTFYADAVLIPSEATLAHNMLIGAPSTIYEIENGSFETGDYTGWVATGTAFNSLYILSIEKYNLFGGEYLYGKDGNYFYTGKDHEGDTGTLTSSTFTLGGTGMITFDLGVAKPKNTAEIYVSIFLADGTEIARFQRNSDTFPTDGNLVPQLETYKADLSQYLGQELYIQVVDNATSDWGWLVLDGVDTYYATTEEVPQDAVIAVNILG